jgi:hypothetical protein
VAYEANPDMTDDAGTARILRSAERMVAKLRDCTVADTTGRHRSELVTTPEHRWELTNRIAALSGFHPMSWTPMRAQDAGDVDGPRGDAIPYPTYYRGV